MKFVFCLFFFFFLLGLSVYFFGVWVEICCVNIGQIMVNIFNIKYLFMLLINIQMISVMVDNGSGIFFFCDLQLLMVSVKCIVYKQLKIGGLLMVINGQYVYFSVIDGIGYVFSFQCVGGLMCVIDGSYFVGGELVVVCDSVMFLVLMMQQ